MTKYFDQFPIIDYNLSGVNGNTTEVTALTSRLTPTPNIENNVT